MTDRRGVAWTLIGALSLCAVWMVFRGAAGADPAAAPSVGPGSEVASEPDARHASATEASLTPTGADVAERTEVTTGPAETPSTAAPRLVAGQVVDDRGVPIAGAQVVLQVYEEIQLGRGSFGISSPIHFEVESARLTGPGPRQLVLEFRGSAEPEGSPVWSPELQVIDLRRSANVQTVDLRQWQIASVPRAVTDEDGRFEIRAAAPPEPFRLDAFDDDHLGATTDALATGADVRIELPRAAILEGELLLPSWLPVEAVDLRMTSLDGGGAVPLSVITEDEEDDSGEVTASRSWFTSDPAVPDSAPLRPGFYDLEVLVRGIDRPVARIPAIHAAAGSEQPDPRPKHIDLTGAVHRYRFLAVGPRGYILDGLGSPLLARLRDDDGVRWAAFPWRDGIAEVFAPLDELEVVFFEPGFRRSEVTVGPGEHSLQFQSVPPVEVLLPDLRALCGPDRRVRVSMVRREGTGMPTGAQAIDPRSGESQSYSRWHLGQSGGAWLGDNDLVRVPLVLGGSYDVIVRLHEKGVAGDASLTVGTADVSLTGPVPQRVVISLDADAIRVALAQLRQRRNP